MIGRLSILTPGLAVLLLATGCTGGPDPRDPPTYPETLTPEAAREAIASRMEGVRSLQAAVTIRSAEGTLGGHLWGESGGRLRIRAKKWFATAFDLLIDGQTVVLHMPQRAKALVADRGDLGEGGGPLLASSELVQALLSPRGPGEAAFAGPSLVITRAGPEGAVDRWIYDRRHLLLRRLRRQGPGGDIELEVSLEGYRRWGEQWWPGVARLETGTKSMEIQLESIEVNRAVGPEHFHIEIPAGTTRVDRMQDLDADPK